MLQTIMPHAKGVLAIRDQSATFLGFVLEPLHYVYVARCRHLSIRENDKCMSKTKFCGMIVSFELYK